MPRLSSKGSNIHLANSVAIPKNLATGTTRLFPTEISSYLKVGFSFVIVNSVCFSCLALL